MASPAPPERYRFGPFELQPDQRRLLKDGETIALRSRAFDLLVAIVDRAGHLLTKDELLDRVWPKMVVNRSAKHICSRTTLIVDGSQFDPKRSVCLEKTRRPQNHRAPQWLTH